MRKKTYDRMVKKIHQANLSVLANPIIIKRLLPLNQQPNYNPKLREWFGPKEWEIIAETMGEFEAFKESEKWEEIGTLGVHDYKCKVNDDKLPKINIEEVSHYIVERVDINQTYHVVFYREFIGEVHLGLRPVVLGHDV